MDVAHLTAEDLLAKMNARGVLASLAGPQQIRFVTHKDVNRSEIDLAVGVMLELAA